MGKIMFYVAPDENSGELRVLNLSLNAFLGTKDNSDEDIKLLKQCLYDDKINLYLTDIQHPAKGSKGIGQYELVAVQDNKTKCFQVKCDVVFQVQGVAKVKAKELSSISQHAVHEIKEGRGPVVGPSMSP